VKELRKHVFIWPFLWALFSCLLISPPVSEVRASFPEVILQQTAHMKVVFLGIRSAFVDQDEFVTGVSLNISQFAYPSTMAWKLNVSVHFEEFPDALMNSLSSNSFLDQGISYYNATLLDVWLSHYENLTVPNRGYLFVFMRVPDGQTVHSWFFVEERPDLFLGRVDYFDGAPLRYWEFPKNFGGRRRAVYFDISDTMEGSPSEAIVTNTASSLFKKATADIFVNLLGTTDSRMILADNQKYENYEVRILWLNGTGGEFSTEGLEESFEDLMPWTNWTATVETRAMDKSLNDLIASQTEELSNLLSYSFVLSNGSRFTLEASRNAKCDFYADSGEHDPLISHFFEHVGGYFNLTDLEDRSVIPVVFLQFANDTAFGRAPQAGVSWFLHNVVIVGFQGSLMTKVGENGQLLLMQILRHEIGHWLSLSHHSFDFASGYPKIICSMRSMIGRFCAFCKDARARMSFIACYNATISLLSQRQADSDALQDDLERALQLFYDWKYTEAINAIMSVPGRAGVQEYDWRLLVAGCLIIAAPLVLIVINRQIRKRRERSHAITKTRLDE